MQRRGEENRKSSTYKAVEHGAGDAAWQTHVHFPRRQLGREGTSSISFLRGSAAAGSGSESVRPGSPQPPRSAAKGRSIPAAGARSRCPLLPPPLDAADNGGREGGGQPDSTYLRRPPSTALPSKCLPDRRDRKWRERWRNHPSSHTRRAGGRGDANDASPSEWPSRAAGREMPAGPRGCSTGNRPRAGNNSGEEALSPGTDPLPRLMRLDAQSGAFCCKPLPEILPPAWQLPEV